MRLPSIALAIALNLVPAVRAADVVPVGPGSYSTQLPEGAKAPPAEIFRTANVPGPMPTNDWWSSLAWVPLSDVMYPHPLAVRAIASGLRVYFPGGNLTANKSAIFGFMAGETDDFTIGHSAVEKFAEARVDGFSHWFVDALFADGAKTLRTSFGHGSPFVFVKIAGGNPTLRFGKEAPKVWARGAAHWAEREAAPLRHLRARLVPLGRIWARLCGPRTSKAKIIFRSPCCRTIARRPSRFSRATRTTTSPTRA